MKLFERNVLTAGISLVSNSSLSARMRWDPRWATSRLAEFSAFTTQYCASHALTRAVQFRLIAWKDFV